MLTASASSAAPGQQLTLTATITGSTPTGNVSFVTDGKILGTSSVINGTATLQISFPTALNATDSSGSLSQVIIFQVTVQ